MKTLKDIPIIVHICCFILAIVFWVMLFSLQDAKSIAAKFVWVYFPLIIMPYMLVEIENQFNLYGNYNEILKRYSNSVSDLWINRLLIMIFASIFYSLVIFAIGGFIGFIFWIYSILF